MFNLGGMEILVILVVALLVLGPDKLPGFMRAAGKALGELRRVSTDLRDTVNTAITDEASSAAKSPHKKTEPEADTFAGKISAQEAASTPSLQQDAAQPEPPADPYANPYSSAPDAAPAPLPMRKRPLPRARRVRPQSAAQPHSTDDAGDA